MMYPSDHVLEPWFRDDDGNEQPATWTAPLRWNRLCTESGIRESVLVGTGGNDLFDLNRPDRFRRRFWELVNNTPALDWMILTQPKKLILAEADRDFPPNVSIGFRVEGGADVLAVSRIRWSEVIEPQRMVFLWIEEEPVAPLYTEKQLDTMNVQWVIAPTPESLASLYTLSAITIAEKLKVPFFACDGRVLNTPSYVRKKGI